MKFHRIGFYVMLFLLCIFFLDAQQGDNSLTRAFTVQNVVDQNTFSIDTFSRSTGDIAFVNGHYYSDKAPLPTLVAIPFYALFSKVLVPQDRAHQSKIAIHVGTFFCATLPFFFIVWMIIQEVFSKGVHSKIVPVLLAIFSGFIYSYASAFWGHMLTAFFLLIVYRCIQNGKYYYAGLAGGAVFACEYMYAIVIACWVIYFFLDSKKMRSTVEICLGCIPGIALVMFNNYLITSNPFEMTYKSFATEGFDAIKTNYGFSFPMLKALYGLSFSDYRGLFIYLPILAPLIFFSYKNKRNGMLFFSLVIFFIVLSSFHFWHGGWAYGPRYLLPLSVILLYVFVKELVHQKTISKWLIGYLLCFCLLHFLGRITTGNSVPTLVEHPFIERVFPQLCSLDFNPNNILSIYFNTSPILAYVIWLLFFILLLYWSHRKELLQK